MKKIKITANGVVILATLNDTVAAKDFEQRLPFKTTGNDSGIDYCCITKEGKYDRNELQDGWNNGDIGFGGGWFALLYGGQEESEVYKDQMIIGHMDDGFEALIERLPSSVEFLVEEA